MRRFFIPVLALMLAVSFKTIAQGTAGGKASTPQAHVVGVNLSGQVSKDGKMFLADDDNTWSVINSNLLKGFEGRHVTVNCRMDLSKRAIHVLDVLQQRLAYHQDSAFYR